MYENENRKKIREKLDWNNKKTNNGGLIHAEMAVAKERGRNNREYPERQINPKSKAPNTDTIQRYNDTA